MGKADDRTLPVELVDLCMHMIDRHYGSFQIHGLCEYENRVDPEVFARAALATCEQVPVLGCTIRPTGLRPRWLRRERIEPGDLVTVEDKRVRAGGDDGVRESRLAVIRGGLDITRELPWRAVLIRGDERDHAVFKFHHSCVDGGAARDVLAVFHRAYLSASIRKYDDVSRSSQVPDGAPSALSPEPASSSPNLRVEGLRLLADPGWRPDGPIPGSRRLKQAFAPFTLRRMLGILGHAVRETFREALARAWTPLWMETAAKEAGPNLREIRIEGERLGAVRARCRTLGITLNDYLLTGLLLSASRWNAARGIAGRRYGVGIAVDLRRAAGVRDAFCNLSGIAPVILRGDRIRDFETTARLVNERTARIKRSYPGLASMAIPAVMNALTPKPVFRLLFRALGARMEKRIRSSTVLTNIGVMEAEPGAFAAAGVRNVSLVAPILPPRAATFTATTYRDALTLSFGYFESAMPGDLSAEFCRLVETNLLPQ